ncbi:hypothetical protein POVWA1_022610 [Plasmodium ovale wallikeri]|uniref:Uncharacterized protein n=1 Tax=Plasmodium ovale wallikeri TaxID=864142 RepID=A0A1A8YS66_PLAOA|nr:hypothetical protein POVWA1_022610 [Plasmodium ovale wallikeri]
MGKCLNCAKKAFQKYGDSVFLLSSGKKRLRALPLANVLRALPLVKALRAMLLVKALRVLPLANVPRVFSP